MRESNVPPADRLADVQDQIWTLEGGEAALRDYLLEDDGDWVGDLFIAEIRTWLQRRVDTKGAWQERRRGRRRALHHQVRGDDGQGQSAGVGRKSD